MDNVMTNGFAELSAMEMEAVNGGDSGVWTAIGITAACVAMAWAAPVGIAVGSGLLISGVSGAGIGAATAGCIGLAGGGAFGKLTGLY